MIPLLLLTVMSELATVIEVKPLTAPVFRIALLKSDREGLAPLAVRVEVPLVERFLPFPTSRLLSSPRMKLPLKFEGLPEPVVMLISPPVAAVMAVLPLPPHE